MADAEEGRSLQDGQFRYSGSLINSKQLVVSHDDLSTANPMVVKHRGSD